jgi:hypothetical protein
MARRLLAPLTSWQATRRMREGGNTEIFSAAWAEVRIDSHPEEAPYIRDWLSADSSRAKVGGPMDGGSMSAFDATRTHCQYT